MPAVVSLELCQVSSLNCGLSRTFATLRLNTSELGPTASFSPNVDAVKGSLGLNRLSEARGTQRPIVPKATYLYNLIGILNWFDCLVPQTILEAPAMYTINHHYCIHLKTICK